MPPPTREEVNALIAYLNVSQWRPYKEAASALTALQAENDWLRAQASPAWVALSERKPTKEDLPYIWSNERGNVFYADLSTPWCDTGSWAIIHWMRVSPCPPPESAADRQRREDEEYASGASEKWRTSPETVYSLVLAALAHARKEATP